MPAGVPPLCGSSLTAARPVVKSSLLTDPLPRPTQLPGVGESFPTPAASATENKYQNKKDDYRQRNVRQFLHILASTGTIAVNVTWMERGFNACQTFPSNSTRSKFKSSPF